tara:strand:+ start:781 stop:1473 length:693 start_codon:yes stop_codon:yes gene_type:complete
MIISHSHKFIFIKIPKTAGTSIVNYLEPYLNQEFRDLDLGDHEAMRDTCNTDYDIYKPGIISILKENNLNQHFDLSDYFKFAFVRNPWDVRLSRYFYLRNTEIAYNTKKNLSTDNSALSLDFKSWCFKGDWFPPRNHGWRKNPPKTEGGQIGFLQNDNFEIDIDYIGKFENLQEDFNNICDQIGIAKKKLPHHNKSKHKHYTKYYDDETRQMVAKEYIKDIEYFGYKFGE